MAQTAWIARWQDLGGIETMLSYGLSRGATITADDVQRRLGDEHLQCLRSAERYVELDHHILVHAGLQPGVPLREQDPHTLMWIRGEFIRERASKSCGPWPYVYRQRPR